jgi:dsDNA-specific endonuclease/ATPase MutS2
MFEIGEKISLLHEKLDGIILEIKGKTVVIKDSIGFQRELSIAEIVKIHGNFDTAKQMKIPAKNGEDQQLKHTSYKSRNDDSKIEKIWEIDLHIEELTETHGHMTNTEIVAKQLNSFKTHYKKAHAKRIEKLIVIHGVGKGVLKSEIHHFLIKQKDSEFYDADYREYGKGATCVEFHYNWKK